MEASGIKVRERRNVGDIFSYPGQPPSHSYPPSLVEDMNERVGNNLELLFRCLWRNPYRFQMNLIGVSHLEDAIIAVFQAQGRLIKDKIHPYKALSGPEKLDGTSYSHSLMLTFEGHSIMTYKACQELFLFIFLLINFNMLYRITLNERDSTSRNALADIIGPKPRTLKL